MALISSIGYAVVDNMFFLDFSWLYGCACSNTSMLVVEFLCSWLYVLLYQIMLSLLLACSIFGCLPFI